MEELDEERAADLVNYEGLEESEEAAAEIAKHANAGRLRVCDSLDKVKEFLGADPVVSKLGLIVKTKAGVTKRRLILDAKESKVSLATAREERIVNPKVLDAVNDALALLAANQDQSAEVIDISDAFWLIPLLPSESRFFVF